MEWRTDTAGRNVAWTLIGGSIATVAATLLVGLVPPVRAWVGLDGSAPAYSVGERIDISPALYENHERTLVVFASGTCSACLRSGPALRSVAKDLRGLPTHLLVLTPEKPAFDEDAFLATLDLRDGEFQHLDLRGLRLKNVPSVLLVDRSGRVLFVREGYVDDVALDAIRRALAITPS